MEIGLLLSGSLSLLIWLYLIFLHGRFWQPGQQLDPDRPEPRHWPGVVALIASGDDAEAVEETLPGLLEQAYPGAFHIVLVVAAGDDDTAETALRVARMVGATDRLSVVTVEAPPPGWSHRTWALAEGRKHAAAHVPAVRYLWLTEPWVQHGRHSLQDLVAKAEADRCGLVSLLPISTCETVWDRLLAPAFAFFFQAFRPLPRVNDPRHDAAAAARGCVLVAADVLAAVGGFAAFKGAPVLESALAAEVKAAARGNERGPWLGLDEESPVIRSGAEWKGLRESALSTAEAQLRRSPTHLAAGMIAMVVACLTPAVVFFWAVAAGFFLDIDQFLITFLAIAVACVAWAGMSFAAWPTFEVYGLEEWRTLLLPLAALAHMLLTLALLPRLMGAARRSGADSVVTTKDETRPHASADRVEPRLEVPPQAPNEPTQGHAHRASTARS